MSRIVAAYRHLRAQLARWPIERWIALASTTVAVCALALSILEWRSARWQARLSLRPHYGCGFIYNSEQGNGWECFNNGLGPARIRGFKIIVDGKSQPAGDTSDIITKALDIPLENIEHTNPRVGDLIKPDTTQRLFWATPGRAANKLMQPWPTTSDRPRVRERVDIEVCYCSMFDECWRFGPPHPISPHTEWWAG